MSKLEILLWMEGGVLVFFLIVAALEIYRRWRYDPKHPERLFR